LGIRRGNGINQPDLVLDDEIEITPAMIEAGVTELVRYNPDYVSKEDAVVRIYEAMFAASIISHHLV
jgi:hypothetical protein